MAKAGNWTGKTSLGIPQFREYRVTESPEVEVRTESELGQEFLKLWEKHLADEPPFGSILAKALDPSNGMRINVTLAWEKNAQGESKMVLKEILGVSWFGQAIQKYRQNSLVNEEEGRGESSCRFPLRKGEGPPRGHGRGRGGNGACRCC